MGKIPKHFILDVGALTAKKDVLQSFGTINNIYVPFATMRELERSYTDRNGERAKIARSVLNYLGSFHIEQLKKGARQQNGSMLRVLVGSGDCEIPQEVQILQNTDYEVKILKACLKVKAERPQGEPVILVSNSAILRKKVEMLGIEAQAFRDELLPEISEQYTGRMVMTVDDELLKKFMEDRKIPLKDAVPNKDERENIYPNMFVELRGKGYGRAEGRVHNGNIVVLSYERYYPYKIIPKNQGQRYMVEPLMMDNELAPLVIVKGPAGTGKTLCALAAALEQVEQGKYPRKILYTRAAVEAGIEIGYLPGGEGEKMAPYLRGCLDALDALHSYDGVIKKHKTSVPPQKQGTGKGGKGKPNHHNYEDEDEKPQNENGHILFTFGIIRTESLGYIRGRTITDTFVIVDEAQNMTPSEMKTLITRIGEGTKMVILGDPAQIDRSELDERNNGLSYAAEHLKGVEYCHQLTLTEEESVRSPIAKMAAMLL